MQGESIEQTKICGLHRKVYISLKRDYIFTKVVILMLNTFFIENTRYLKR